LPVRDKSQESPEADRQSCANSKSILIHFVLPANRTQIAIATVDLETMNNFAVLGDRRLENRRRIFQRAIIFAVLAAIIPHHRLRHKLARAGHRPLRRRQNLP